jgi:hypothetical protein
LEPKKKTFLFYFIFIFIFFPRVEFSCECVNLI